MDEDKSSSTFCFYGEHAVTLDQFHALLEVLKARREIEVQTSSSANLQRSGELHRQIAVLQKLEDGLYRCIAGTGLSAGQQQPGDTALTFGTAVPAWPGTSASSAPFASMFGTSGASPFSTN